MKISFLVPHLKLKGGIRRVIELSSHLISMGIYVSIFHSDGSKCRWLDVKADIFSLEDFLNREHDVLVYYDQIDYKNVKQVKARKKYFYCCNLYNKKNLLLPCFLLFFIDKRAYQLKKALLDKDVKIIVNCTDSKNWLRENMDISSEVVLGGVDQKMFYPAEFEKEENKMKVLCIGGNRLWKGTSTIRRAVEIAKKEVPSLFMDEYTGKGLPQSEMAREYSSADIFVDAQYYAGWNNPIAEAMACKVPVICGDIEQNKEVAVDGVNSIIVPVRDEEAYAKAIVRLAKDEGLRKKLAENAYNNILKFTWKSAAEKMLAILRS